ncbi:MAG: hypothetical protein H6815_03150 [Phycisphaeraceae bacterium]|nr:hypothetical protein [Phycisphaerales bacterium]MCB9859425.1 hypothetical protein [Phycisphaeraceae bacterium]
MAPISRHDDDIPLDDQPSRAIARRARAAKKQSVVGDVDDGYDLDPEGPTQDDIERFNSPTVRCKNCNRETFDDIGACPHCGELVDTVSEKRLPAWALVTVAAVLIGVVLVFVL